MLTDPDRAVTEVRCTRDPATRGNTLDRRKVKATTYRVRADYTVDAPVGPRNEWANIQKRQGGA